MVSICTETKGANVETRHPATGARGVWGGLLQHARKRAKRLLFEMETDYAEVLSGLLAMGWGVGILLPEPNSAQTDVYRAMVGMAPAWAWGGAILCLGAVQFVAVVLGFEHVRQAAAIVAGPFWTFVALVILIAGYQTTYFIFYAIFAFSCGWAYLRLAWGLAQRTQGARRRR